MFCRHLSLVHCHTAVIMLWFIMEVITFSCSSTEFVFPFARDGVGSCTCTLLQMLRKEGSSFCLCVSVDVNPHTLHCHC